MCKEYLVLERECLTEWYLRRARRFDEGEKKKYAEWFREYGFVAFDEGIKLEYVKLDDCKSITGGRKPDGAFCGCNNSCYIIDEAQWKMLLEVNEKNKKADILKEIDEQISECEEIIKKCEKQKKLYTKEEVIKKRDEYNKTYNEGGEGYVPHYYTFEEYDFTRKTLDRLNREKKEMQNGRY